MNDIFALERALARYRSVPLVVVVEHTPPARKGETRPAPELVSATLAPHRFVDFGFRLTGEPVSSVHGGSPAEKAGFRKGDKIVKVDGRDDFDPMRLPDLCFDKAGQPMTFEVERAGAGGTPERVTLTATPDDSPPWVQPPIPPDLPVDVTGLGLAIPLRPRVSAVTPGSPADRAGIKVNDVIDSLTLPDLKPPPKTFWTRVFGARSPSRSYSRRGRVCRGSRFS